jgi:glycosyltransferase involved in cell wall biosynthesis
VVVLTSLSEGQPLVILEANCAGLPIIATDVGACRELLFGVTPEDQALGASGLITPVASPHETARAMVVLWQDKNLRQRMGKAGQERVKQFYSQEKVKSSYRSIYRQYGNIMMKRTQKTRKLRVFAAKSAAAGALSKAKSRAKAKSKSK